MYGKTSVAGPITFANVGRGQPSGLLVEAGQSLWSVPRMTMSVEAPSRSSRGHGWSSPTPPYLNESNVTIDAPEPEGVVLTELLNAPSGPERPSTKNSA